MRNRIAVMLMVLLGLVFNTSAKEVPEGRFLKKSVKIGEPVRFILVYKHLPDQEVVFPDSAYRFFPFEYIRRESFPTRTNGHVSTDSAVYYLRTFETEPDLTLQLPVFILTANDTVTLPGNATTIRLQEVVNKVTDPPVFKTNADLQVISERFNAAYWGAGILGLFAVLALVWFSFRDRILRRYRIYKLAKNHTYFVNRFNAYIDRFHKSASAQNMEKAITLWKNYLSELENKAINSFTTKEIVTFYENDEDVTTALKLFDRAIYGNIVSENVAETLTAFYLLHHFADRRYETLKEQTRNATAA